VAITRSPRPHNSTTKSFGFKISSVGLLPAERLCHLVAGSPLWVGLGENVVRKRRLRIHSAEETAQPVVGDEQRLEGSRPRRRALKQLPVFATGIRAHAHIGSGASEDGRKPAQRRHADAVPKQAHHPLAITHVPQAGIEGKSVIGHDSPAKKSRTT